MGLSFCLHVDHRLCLYSHVSVSVSTCSAPWKPPSMAASPQTSAAAAAPAVAATTAEGVGASSASLLPAPPCRRGGWASPALVCRRAMPPLWTVTVDGRLAAREGATCTPGTSDGSWPAGGQPPAAWTSETEPERTVTWTASPWRSPDTWAMETCWARTPRALMTSPAGEWFTPMEIFKPYKQVFKLSIWDL